MNEVVADIAVIHLEPIALSGERVAIGIISRTDEGEVRIESTLSERAASSLFGAGGGRLLSVVEMAMRSIERHWRQGLDPAQWAPPSPSISIGKRHRIGADNLDQLMRDAMRRYAHYSAITQFPRRDTFTRWISDIRAETLRDHEQWGGYFNRSFQVRADARPTAIEFAGKSSAFGFGVLSGNGAIGQSVALAKGKIWNLVSLQDAIANKGLSDDLWPFEPTWFEMVLKLPGKTSASRDEAKAALVELETEGDRHNVRVTGVETATAAVKRIELVEH